MPDLEQAIYVLAAAFLVAAWIVAYALRAHAKTTFNVRLQGTVAQHVDPIDVRHTHGTPREPWQGDGE